MPDLADPERLPDLVACLRADADHAEERAELARAVALDLEAMSAADLARHEAAALRRHAVRRAGLAVDAADKVDVVLLGVERLWPWWRRAYHALRLLSLGWPWLTARRPAPDTPPAPPPDA